MTPHPLRLVLGRTGAIRAALLLAVDDGGEASGRRIAHHAGIPASTALAHLHEMADAGMLRTRELGGAVLYRRAVGHLGGDALLRIAREAMAR